MQDRITKLCSKLLRSEDPEEFRPVARQLKEAIRERVQSVRENAVELALLDQIFDVRSVSEEMQRQGSDRN